MLLKIGNKGNTEETGGFLLRKIAKNSKKRKTDFSGQFENISHYFYKGYLSGIV